VRILFMVGAGANGKSKKTRILQKQVIVLVSPRLLCWPTK
jgi:hypothetical protein